jgi:hypothetical protein
LEALSDRLAHVGQGDVLERGRSSGSSRRTAANCSLLHILLSNLATRAGSLDAGQGNTLLLGETLGGRSDIELTLKGGLQSVAGGRILLRLWSRFLGRFRLLLLLGCGFRSITTSVVDAERLECRDIATFLDENGDGLDDISVKVFLRHGKR